MEPQESRPRVGVILATPISVLLGVLFFMPWLTVSCDGQAALELNGAVDSPQAAAMAAAVDPSAAVAEASGMELAQGEITPCGAYEGQNVSSSTGHSPSSRSWVYAGLALPAAMLVACLLCLTGNIQASAAGKAIFLIAFVGAGMMYGVSQISYADDMIDKVSELSETAGARAPAAMRAQASAEIDRLSENVNAVVLTTPTAMLWVTMGLYGAACVCGVMTIGPPTPESEKAMAKSTAPSHVRDFQFTPSAPREASREKRRSSGGALPQFGPDLFAPDGSTKPGAKGR